MLEIGTERETEHRETENVVREAFWNVYSPGCDEHYLVHRIRRSAAFIPELNLVARERGRVVGYVTNLRAVIAGDDGRRHEVVALGPIAVLPQCQRTGIGTRLIAAVKDIAQGLRFRAIVLCGDPAFYAKQGFESAETYGIRNAENYFADALQVCGLHAGALRGLAGRYHEDSVYTVSKADVREYDKNFPQKTPVSGTPSQRRFLEMVAKCRPYTGPQPEG